MKNINVKPFLYILLIFSGAIWFVVAMLKGMNMTSFLDFMSLIPSVVTADMLLVAIFVKWGWKWKWLQYWLVPFPDLNGTWIGKLQTNWKDDQGKTLEPIPVMLTIHQSFFHLSCVMRTNEMTSHSYVEGFCIDPDRQLKKLCYSYSSSPKIALRERSTPHDGTAVFNIVGTPIHKLDGEYWTQRQTTGSITLAFHSKEILDELPQ